MLIVYRYLFVSYSSKFLMYICEYETSIIYMSVGRCLFDSL